MILIFKLIKKKKNNGAGSFFVNIQDKKSMNYNLLTTPLTYSYFFLNFAQFLQYLILLF
jgi:hypothetical protein